jgi:predicted DsbA family dithiol-disulfide isomerase
MLLGRRGAAVVQADASARSTIALHLDHAVDEGFQALSRRRTAAEHGDRPVQHGDDVDLRIHTFQLDPAAATTVAPTLDVFSKKYGAPARAMEQGMAEPAAAEGLTYEVDRPARNTLDLLRLVKLGDEHGVGWQYLRAMQAEVFSGNFEAFEQDTVVRLGERLGIPAGEIRGVLATDRYADEVRPGVAAGPAATAEAT